MSPADGVSRTPAKFSARQPARAGGAGHAASGAADAGPYVITFAAALERMPLAVPFLHELDHFSAFRSHSIERGRAVFRLHVGYFDSQDLARAALGVVQRYYTDAHIATAPRRDLGSLDDTGITEFSMAVPAAARAAAPGTASHGARDAGPSVLVDGSSCDTALQRYAIQLEALSRAESSKSAPTVAAFRAHTLYRIYVLVDGVLHQALRLGFFPSVAAAQRVLAHVRDDFPRANLVPVSGREYGRIRDLAVSGGTQAPAQPLAGAAAAAPNEYAASDDDVSCEFGAHELPTTIRVAPPARQR